ncbi:spore germination protein [Gottfriedia acidiceleris]|uniref:Spore germination protein n=1 Tax=Gottfriedia acidiceleris TaxID=371036 RepID=A0ABY4JRC0_9BACI|nr:spore germination protein [Gottfriedia acidiceleris]UPM55398.1 spore germination protein [Gottfriedia acidiceleris]
MDYSNEQKKRLRKFNLRSSVIHTEGNLIENFNIIQKIFPTSDLVKKKLIINDKLAMLFYLSGLVDEKKIAHFINTISINSNLNETNLFITNNTERTNQILEIEKFILEGKSILFIEGDPISFVYSTENWPQRSYMPPSIDNSLKGSKISFVETYQSNIALLRRLIQSRDFQIKQTEVGKENKTLVAISYIDGLIDEDLLSGINQKIASLKIDNLLSANHLAQLMEGNPFSPFPQFLTTERPDVAALSLLEGKVVIVVDCSSEVIILPINFAIFFKTIDDYTSRAIVTSFNRILRIFAFFITIFLPGVYIAIISFNYEIVPLKLLLSIGESRAKVPFDPLFEAIVMELTLEMLREAAIRLPSPISTTVGVVGGIVIGQAAVQAGIVSNIMVIVVAITAISSFIIPNYEMASSLRVIRFPVMIMASLFGLIGLIVSTMVLMIHGLSLSSFDKPYTLPFSPINREAFMDTFIRVPLRYLWKKHSKRNEE